MKHELNASAQRDDGRLANDYETVQSSRLHGGEFGNVGLIPTSRRGTRKMWLAFDSGDGFHHPELILYMPILVATFVA